MAKEISNSDDIIDSRDVIARIEELQSERADLQGAADEMNELEGFYVEDCGDCYQSVFPTGLAEHSQTHSTYDDAIAYIKEIAGDVTVRTDSALCRPKNATARDALKEWDSDYGAELKTLEAFANEAEGYISDWKHGEALIRDSYFEDYAQELADDIGAINSDATWPNNCIDWERAARELQMDYTAIDFDGVTYWAR